MIRTRLFIGFAILVLTFGILSAVVGVRLIQNSVITEAQTRVHSDLNSAWSLADAELHKVEMILKLVAGKQIVMDACTQNSWPNPVVQNRLEFIRMNFDLDFLTLISPKGEVVVRSAPPYNTGDYHLSSAIILKAMQGETVQGREVLSANELEREQEGLADRAFMMIEATPHARENERRTESRGLADIAAVPVMQGNQLIGVLYGGVLLNKNHAYIDRLANALYKKDLTAGSVTLFLNDSRIATTVTLPNGNRAIGTRGSRDVAEWVLDNGNRWEGKAFVVNDWYLAAYDPIRDSGGKVIGMLYVGILEKPFKAVVRETIWQYVILSMFGLSIALILAFFLAGTLAQPLHRLAEAAQKMLLGQHPGPVTDTHASHETKNLILAFNEMAEAIAEREGKLREANQKLEDTNVTLTGVNRNYMETLGFISHELKSPLSTILNYVYLLHEKKLGPLTDKQGRAMKSIDNNVRLLVEMIRHYLNLSRIENGELTPYLTRVELLKEVLRPLLDSFEAAAEEREMAILNGIDTHLALYADLNMTREVFENLISNAIKYGKKGGILKISAEPQGEFMRLSVYNEGDGIQADSLPLLFQKFSRLEAQKSTRSQKGTGLGLFICKQIISAHGGEISVESEPGQWVEFTVALPRFHEESGHVHTEKNSLN